MELVRSTNIAVQKPRVKDELLFIARYPEIAKELLAMTPPDYPIRN